MTSQQQQSRNFNFAASPSASTQLALVGANRMDNVSVLTNPEIYKEARERVAQAGRALDEKRKEYSEYLKQLEAKFKQHVAILEEEEAQAFDQVQIMKNAASRAVKREITRINADPSIAPDEKAKRINHINNTYRKTFHPDDDFQRYVEEKAVDSLSSSIGMMFGIPMHSMIRQVFSGPGQGMDERYAKRNRQPNQSVIIEEVNEEEEED